jgi:prepilin-type N-terminal cleavage/methylation domain-containing protein
MQTKFRRIRNSKGFTLIELMIVVVIIGILAAIAIPKFGQASNRAKEKEADGIIKQVYTLQSAFRADKGRLATDVAELTTVGFEQPTSLSNYTFNTGVATSPYCLTPNPATAAWSQRCIDLTTGVITTPAAAATP